LEKKNGKKGEEGKDNLKRVPHGCRPPDYAGPCDNQRKSGGKSGRKSTPGRCEKNWQNTAGLTEKLGTRKKKAITK